MGRSGVFKDVVVGHVEHTWNWCVWWDGVRCFKTLMLRNLA